MSRLRSVGCLLLGLAFAAGSSPAWASKCDPLEVRRTRNEPRVLDDPITVVTASRARAADGFGCRRKDVQIEGAGGEKGIVGVMASKLVTFLVIPDGEPLWLAGDRPAREVPLVTNAVLLLEGFDAKGKPAGSWFVGDPGVTVTVGGDRAEALPTDGPIDLSETIGSGRALQFRVSALSVTGSAGIGSAFLVSESHRLEVERVEEERKQKEAERQAALAAQRGTLTTPEEDRATVASFAESTWVDDDPEWADQLVRVGDVDNCGLGFPDGFNPFLGQSTSPHSSPFYPDASDPPGTDRIMVGSGYDGNPPQGKDDYVKQAGSRIVVAEPLHFEFLAPSEPIEKVLLQIFVDDLQPRAWGGHVRVTLDGRRAPNLERILDRLEQTEKTGKLVSLEILPEFYDTLADGDLTLLIDDPTTGAGDGFAIDFAQLAINPRSDLPYGSEVRGVLRDEATGEPLAGALVSTGFSEAVTNEKGEYVLQGVPAGAVVVQVIIEGYSTATIQIQVTAGEVSEAPEIQAAPRREGDFVEELEREGTVTLPGLQFPSGSAELTADAIGALRQAARAIKATPGLQLDVCGHTDHIGDADENMKLSIERAERVVEWLVEQGIAPRRLRARGRGEEEPLGSGTTPAANAANRRVEFVAVQE